MGKAENMEEMAGRYFDGHQAPGLRESGVPEDGIAFMRKSYIQGVLSSPEAQEQVLAALILED